MIVFALGFIVGATVAVLGTCWFLGWAKRNGVIEVRK